MANASAGGLFLATPSRARLSPCCAQKRQVKRALSDVLRVCGSASSVARGDDDSELATVQVNRLGQFEKHAQDAKQGWEDAASFAQALKGAGSELAQMMSTPLLFELFALELPDLAAEMSKQLRAVQVQGLEEHDP